jgi:predicted RecA/RadA family phage recombinase
MAVTGGFRIAGADIPAVAAAAIGKGIVVKLAADTSAGDRGVDVCGTSDIPFGVALDDIASGESGAIRTEGIALVSANGAFSIGDELCVAAADGQVDSLTADGWSLGIALHAATAANDLLPCKLNIHYHNVP